ncbi:hypothetical protein PV04_01987 [Phialophora macrospora]|uniref:Post-SET domain-containing protein n=1 Tax=Phialophora macrospora TaxID=1851006 RepID=A0A0D2EHR9_9EURO|nr:hypothetical protein PV04_01987 [Phialophora macrospora]
MPPANSPTATRPSTPPLMTYLQHIQEAIATPVPDLASTLTPSPPRARSREDQGEVRTGTQDNDVGRSQLQPASDDLFSRRTYLTEEEFQYWSAENRARVMMQSERTRARTTLSAAMQRELDRRSYPATADGIHRRNLYDFAMRGIPPPEFPEQYSSDDSDGEMEGMSTAAPNADPNARRDLQRLERAVQNYRSARNTMRTSRSGGSDLGAVPTASALRAYWNEDEDNTMRLPRTGTLGERLQRDAIPAHAQSARTSHEPRFISPTEPKPPDAFTRVRKLLRYLSELRDTGVEGGLEAARRLGLDSLYASEDSNTPSDLPMHINSLPVPPWSSWLQPGMVWNGRQSVGCEMINHSRLLAAVLRRDRQGDMFRRMPFLRTEILSRFGGDESARASQDPLLDAERYLSDLLQDNNGRWSLSQRSATSLSSHPPQASQSLDFDGWPVNVTITTVDWQTMTLTGTMSASHMPDKLSSIHQSTSPDNTAAAASSMSSCFTGEIIDFRRHPLETEKEGRDYEVGGLDVDARYWQRLGPFKKEIARVRHLQGRKRSEYQHNSALWDAFRKAAGQEAENKESHGSGGGSAASPEPGNFEPHQKMFETEEDKEIQADQIMARCLGSAKWMDENVGSEWILMRWKERCFVTPPGSSKNPSSTRTILTTTTTPSAAPSGAAGAARSNGSTSWGLTISGFYYIALNRLTGQIDGLYYDPGSQPYQPLKMMPEGTSRPSANGHPQVCACGMRDCKEPVGIKKWFPSMGFR